VRQHAACYETRRRIDRAVARVISTAFCVALLAATAGAFTLTEGAKTELSPIYGTDVPHNVFSPACRCATATVPIGFRLRKADRLTIWMVRGDERVATIVSGRAYLRGLVSLQFTGRDGRAVLPEGIYYPVVHLAQQHRTITLPNPVEIDTTPPRFVSFRHFQAVQTISPDGDGAGDVFTVRYSLDEKAHAVLLVDGKQVWFARRALRGAASWNGKLGGRVALPGQTHVVTMLAEDEAGNRSKPVEVARVKVRYVALGRTRVAVGPGQPFEVSVSADAPTVSWLLAGVRGTSRSHTLHVQAPASPGTYTLFVSVGSHAASAVVVVG